jgi:hypothetical protein
MLDVRACALPGAMPADRQPRTRERRRRDFERIVMSDRRTQCPDALPPAPRSQIDDVGECSGTLAASGVILACQPLRPVGIVPELHSRCARARRDRLPARLARWPVRPSAIHELVFEKHTTLRTCNWTNPIPSHGARAPVRDGQTIPVNASRSIVFPAAGAPPVAGTAVVPELYRRRTWQRCTEAVGGQWQNRAEQYMKRPVPPLSSSRGQFRDNKR